MTSLYSIYHGSRVSDEKVVINSNERALEKIRAWQKHAEDEKLRQRRSEADEYLIPALILFICNYALIIHIAP